MTNEQRKQICVEAIKQFGNQQWLRDVIVYDSHPNTGEPTLELKVNYVPIFERKSVIAFAEKYGLTERFLTVDANGNPTE